MGKTDNMNQNISSRLAQLLNEYKTGKVDFREAQEIIESLTNNDVNEYSNLDIHRRERTGIPEVIFADGKTPAQVAGIFQRLVSDDFGVLATRVTPAMYLEIKDMLLDAEYSPETHLLFSRPKNLVKKSPGIAVVTAGTSDIPVAEEAAVTAEMMGHDVQRIFDVGVAGVHRLFNRLDDLRKANVVIVAAGMEGALPSVIGGLISAPIIALPTSVGYGASFGGLAALLGMLNSCSPGLAVVNIDNGFGAGCMAAKINARIWQTHE